MSSAGMACGLLAKLALPSELKARLRKPRAAAWRVYLP